jgi:hypothetical protein
MSRKHRTPLLLRHGVGTGVIVGLLCGFFVGAVTKLILAPCVSSLRHLDDVESADVMQLALHVENATLARSLDPRLDPGGLVLIGVMTARKYLDGRIAALHATWAQHAHRHGAKVLIFSSAGSEEDAPPGIPVIGLPGVDDAYPPQKKSFMMLKYMHDYYGDKYRFFMRADDDIYIKTDRLAQLLHTINSSEPIFMGQAGMGTSEEIGRMHLAPGENFCMGGPGMVLSRTTLALMAPHVSTCLKNLYTTHEDVEVGRCIKKYAGVSCTWAYEVRKLRSVACRTRQELVPGPATSWLSITDHC